MTLFDPRTAVLMGGLMSGLMAVVLYALKRNYPSTIKGLGEWSLGFGLLFLGAGLGSVRDLWPDAISIALARLSMAVGVYGVYLGTQRFFGVDTHLRPWATLLVVYGLVQLWFTVVVPSYQVRLGLANVLVGTLAAG